MSCNGCRILRKGCSDNCMLRQCLQWIGSPKAQANATVFVAKFFGRAGLMSFLSNVPETQRPALFQSLLYEAVGRTVNPVSGAVGLLWKGNWNVCQRAVETVLCGGELHPLPDVLTESDDVSESDVLNCASLSFTAREGISVPLKRICEPAGDDDLTLTTSLPSRGVKRRAPAPSEESQTTTYESGLENYGCEGGERKVLRLFV
ncbi:LOB domain-containing protein 37-like [Mangifera indica]|uniref:LOB domain-containing protein 37-like n=1 Tax=Mangifera indica TaxID=29780 RepID=UPI001CFA6CE6|nr:LOB domain-containing protein 37-like [Mangifera indica]